MNHRGFESIIFVNTPIQRIYIQLVDF